LPVNAKAALFGIYAYDLPSGGEPRKPARVSAHDEKAIKSIDLLIGFISIVLRVQQATR